MDGAQMRCTVFVSVFVSVFIYFCNFSHTCICNCISGWMAQKWDALEDGLHMRPKGGLNKLDKAPCISIRAVFGSCCFLICCICLNSSNHISNADVDVDVDFDIAFCRICWCKCWRFMCLPNTINACGHVDETSHLIWCEPSSQNPKCEFANWVCC